MKTLLFDIDGTLIVTNETGTRALEAVLRDQFGVVRPNLEVRFGGRTDRSLLNELMLINDIKPTETNFDIFTTEYGAILPKVLQKCGGSVLPGVEALLTRLRLHQDLRCAIMTGNLKATATQKLRHFGLRGYFDDIFGGDFDSDRRHLARRTALYLRGAHGHQATDGTIVIGDTPADIVCGLDIDARVMAVCTGHFDRQTLETAGAHVVHRDFSDVDRVYRWLTQ
ncbi:MAG: hydrolase [Rhodopirellula sp.]|nr:hydrolase [Rhodopirellula sp.]